MTTQSIKAFITEASLTNCQQFAAIAQHYDRSITDLKRALECRVVVKSGRPSINFTDSQTGITINHK